MIKSAGMVNFLSHRESLVEFGPGLNVISGVSDAGKSAVIRAMTWIFKNKPNGDAIKNWNASKKDSVIVEMMLASPLTNRDESILKERTNTTSSYTLSTLSEPLNVVGRDVPTEVQEMINFSELNFKGQHDPYLLSISGGALAKMINDLVGLSIIDTSTKNLNRKANTLKGRCEGLTSDISTASSAIEQLSYLDQMKIDIEEIEQLQQDKNQTVRVAFELGKLIQLIQETQTEIDDNAQTLRVKPFVDEMRYVLDGYQVHTDLAGALQTEIKTIKSIQEAMADEQETLKAKPFVDEINIIVKQYNEIIKKQDAIDNLIVSCIEIQNRRRDARDNITMAQQNFSAYLKKVGVCPTCHHPFDKKTIEEMTK